MNPRIRLATPDDAPQIASIYAPFCHQTAVTFEIVAPHADEMEQRILALSQCYPWLVYLDQAGDTLGYACASPHHVRAAYQWSVDLAIYVAPGNWRLGVGRRLYTAIFRALALQGYVKAHAAITLPNLGSVGLHESMGFQKIGIFPRVGYKLGSWHDVVYYQRNIAPEPEHPSPPRLIADVRYTADWNECMALEPAVHNRSAGV